MVNEQKIKFGLVLKKIRSNKKMSQIMLSKKSGVPQTTISDWETDKYLPNIIEVKKLASALDVSLLDLLNDGAEKSKV